MDIYAEAGGFDADSSYTTEGKKDRVRGPNNLTPLTCADIHSMTGEKWTFNNHQAEKICLVGVIRSIDISSLKATLIVDDRTGPPVICQSMDMQDAELERLTEGMYIKIFGLLRRQSVNKEEDMKTMINVIKLRAVSTLNEVTRHMLECIRAKVAYLTTDQRLELTGGKESSGGQSSRNQGGSGGDAMDDSGVPGLNKNQHIVYKAIQEGGSLGINIEKVTSKLAAHGLKEREIRDALEFLSNEGHVFTTIDDDTYACVDA